MDEILESYHAYLLSGADVIHAALQDGYNLKESLMMLGFTSLNELGIKSVTLMQITSQS